MKVLHLRVGAIGTNCYIVYDEKTKEGAVVDPGDNAPAILQAAQDAGVKLQFILLTHAHFDHVLAAAEIKEATGARLVLHEADLGLLKEEAIIKAYAAPEVDILATEGTQVTFGGMTATYLHTPGHTPGSCCIRLGDCLFTGDTMFRRECGRCDLAGGNFDHMLDSLKRLHDLPGDFQVLPGHEGMTTLAQERKLNPYVLQALAR